MDQFLNWLRGIRVSNLIFVLFLPLITYFLMTSRNYGKAFKAILGVDENALSLFISFLILLVIGLLGFFAASKLWRSIDLEIEHETRASYCRVANLCLGLQSLLLLLLQNLTVLEPYVMSVVINSMDARTTDWVMIVNQSFSVTEEVKSKIVTRTSSFLNFALIFSLLSFFFSILPSQVKASKFGKFIILIIGLTGFTVTFYVLMIAHAGFAKGLMVTIRAAFFAYFLASVLGLIWALLTKLKPSNKSSVIYLMVSLVFFVIGVFSLNQPYSKVSLVGNLQGKIGIISGTPSIISDKVRYGDFLVTPPKLPFKIRSLKDLDQAMSLLEKGKLTAVLVPSSEVSNHQIVWSTSYLPSVQKNIGIFCLVFGLFVFILVIIGRLTKMHPLAIFSDFFVDTIRGIPMLVIILYIGLPLAGAVKNVSGGYIDIQMMTRGIIAIGIGYSAYMAEIFRAGIEAIPKGQIEAARTLGMKEWHIARFIVLPQAIAIVLPALGNEFIAMLKDTSLVSILSVRDITQRMREFQAQSFLPFEPFNSAALLYILLTLMAASGIKSLEKIVNKNREDTG